MFNRHQAEITVMQFRGHSLPVHHSVVYHGNFSCSSHFISQFPPTRFPLLTAIRMCHLLPVHHLGMAFLAGQKVKTYQMSKTRTKLWKPVSELAVCNDILFINTTSFLNWFSCIFVILKLPQLYMLNKCFKFIHFRCMIS